MIENLANKILDSIYRRGMLPNVSEKNYRENILAEIMAVDTAKGVISVIERWFAKYNHSGLSEDAINIITKLVSVSNKTSSTTENLATKIADSLIADGWVGRLWDSNMQKQSKEKLVVDIMAMETIDEIVLMLMENWVPNDRYTRQNLTAYIRGILTGPTTKPVEKSGFAVKTLDEKVKEALDDDDWIDVGFEITPGGQKTHTWVKPKDVRSYVENLRKRIKDLETIVENTKKSAITDDQTE